jgi:hypothetical protein
MRGMKLPRFRLRTLFVLIVLAAIPLGWVAYQMNWIMQRHGFLAHHAKPPPPPPWPIRTDGERFPWALELFGERPEQFVWAGDSSDARRAQELFPEATVDMVSP